MINLLTDVQKNRLRSVIEYGYLHGKCYEFAIALHRLTNFRIVGLSSTQHDHPVHVGLADNDGEHFIDIRGKILFQEFIREYATYAPLKLVYMTEEDCINVLLKFEKTKEDVERHIKIASEHITFLFSEYDQKYQEKLLAFLEDLKAISEKHGIYIRAPYPTTQPILYNSYGDEKGYKITYHDSNVMTIDRILD